MNIITNEIKQQPFYNIFVLGLFVQLYNFKDEYYKTLA